MGFASPGEIWLAHSLSKSGHKAIDSGPEGRYCACFRLGRTKNAQKSEVGMLGILRNAAGTWVAKALLSLLVISFAVWGISGR
ncbi:hypothetical protein EN781_32420, partial [Mesorhizobium sp. M4A.F.Ca.ET.090.04.2.1]